MFWTRQQELVELIDSFQSSISEKILAEILEYVDYHEFGIAIEILSETIYESDVFVSDDQCARLLSLSKNFGVDENYHKFVGKTPPYPDLRTDEQKGFGNKTSGGDGLEKIRLLAARGAIIEAVKIYRAQFGASLAEAVEKVKELAEDGNE